LDSLTHIVLGAALGDLSAGRQIGKKAMVYGAILGTLPDSDVVVGAFMNDIDKIIFHRGITHSMLFWAVMSPLCGLLISKNEPGRHITFFRASLMSLLIFSSHALLDSFTSYGTRLLIPFTFDAYAFSTLSIIDPFFSIWLWLAIAYVLIRKPVIAKRRKILITAIMLSFLYMGATVLNKYYVNNQFHQIFTDQEFRVLRFSSKPALFSNLLWTGIAETEDGFYTAYFTVLQGSRTIPVSYIKKDHHLILPFKDSEAVHRLKDVTQGYYTAEYSNGTLIIHDLRFGKLTPRTDEKGQYVFSYEINEINGEVIIERIPLEFNRDRDLKMIRDLFDRIKGINPNGL
jgi:inner membrane protein